MESYSDACPPYNVPVKGRIVQKTAPDGLGPFPGGVLSPGPLLLHFTFYHLITILPQAVKSEHTMNTVFSPGKQCILVHWLRLLKQAVEDETSLVRAGLTPCASFGQRGSKRPCLLFFVRLLCSGGIG